MPSLPTDPAYVALALVPGIGKARLDALLAAFGSPGAVLEAPQEALRAVPGMTPAAATAIRETSPAVGQKLIDRAQAHGGTVLAPADGRFPPMLRLIPEAPTLLFAAGRLELLARPAVAIVGSRSHTRYGAEACRHLAGGLARAGLVVVSGMARGIDAIAHNAALDVGGDTIGVLGNGLGVVYPSANRTLYESVAARGCLLTEHPPGEKPHAGSFPRRNRLISGLARVTVVVEARAKSGALITADNALSQGHDVLAVPGPITSPLSAGCNRLIQQGAKPALGLRDVLEEYGLAASAEVPAASVPADLTEHERRTLAALTTDPEHVDGVALRVDLPPWDLLAVLTSLEIRGLVIQEPGKAFRRAEGMLR
ncbi:MAG TPA: DNA-processing protein DprA [Gemmatimonadales bacterium]|nr:DNA-processing protein DprA [Gemmatimonadales bacterium]